MKKMFILFLFFVCAFCFYYLDLSKRINMVDAHEEWNFQLRGRNRKDAIRATLSEGVKWNNVNLTEKGGKDLVWNENMSSQKLSLRLRAWKYAFHILNSYGVTFNGRRGQNLSPQELLCEIRNRVNMSMVRSSDLPLSASKWSKYLPTKSFQEEAGSFGKCAVVSSAGSIKSSSLGSEIDSHDAVIRFNAAPTAGFETDVGSKVTFRLVNSQVVFHSEYKFLEDPMYHSGILIVWDPAPYNANIYKWYKNPEFKFLNRYREYRQRNPGQPFYVLNPQTLWQIWDILQENSLEEIHPEPPSTGLLGILLMMNLCDQVNVYEFLPSKRQTDLCHYYESFYNIACSMGTYHPIMFEKNMIKKLNLGDDESIYNYGRVTLPGLKDLKCKNRTTS
ncbi:beta-galactoside alpha-2,6-sialyltransferase 1-like isoform 2-T2 [Discoglossus pictus]